MKSSRQLLILPNLTLLGEMFTAEQATNKAHAFAYISVTSYTHRPQNIRKTLAFEVPVLDGLRGK